MILLQYHGIHDGIVNVVVGIGNQCRQRICCLVTYVVADAFDPKSGLLGFILSMVCLSSMQKSIGLGKALRGGVITLITTNIVIMVGAVLACRLNGTGPLHSSLPIWGQHLVLFIV